MNAPNIETRKPVILAVDDNLDNLILLEFQLAYFQPCSFLSAMTGRDALTLAERETLDLILLDIHLPDIEGTEVARKLKNNPKTARTPIVAITALARKEDRDRILAAGCDDYLSKPYDLEDLETIIYRYCPQHSLP